MSGRQYVFVGLAFAVIGAVAFLALLLWPISPR